MVCILGKHFNRQQFPHQGSHVQQFPQSTKEANIRKPHFRLVPIKPRHSHPLSKYEKNYLADFAKEGRGKEETSLRVSLMTKMSTTATNQPQHIVGLLLDTQRGRKREQNREAPSIRSLTSQIVDPSLAILSQQWRQISPETDEGRRIRRARKENPRGTDFGISL